MRRTAPAALLLVPVLVLALVLAGCGSAPDATPRQASGQSTQSATPDPMDADHDEGHGASQAPLPDTREASLGAKPLPLRLGERRTTLRLAAPYTPSAPNGVGTDDYRCFLLDPRLTSTAFLTGFDIRPDNPRVVHHVILFKAPADKLDRARQLDEAEPGEGWTCFGDSGLEDGPTLDDAPWLGAWAPGGRERRYGRGFGIPLKPGERIVAQIHYNLLRGSSPDRSSVVLRLDDTTRGLRALHTMLLPAPVELPCRPDNRGPLCRRDRALADVKARFGDRPGATADLLHVLCGSRPRAGTVQRCTRTLQRPMTIRAAAGHMHLLGTSIRITAQRAGEPRRRVLDIPVWDFDNQGSTPVEPLRLNTWDKVTVSCHHAQWLRDQQPSFARQRRDRYVLWGEGSTDEMCLGILLTTDR